MKDYVAYHKAEPMGDGALDVNNLAIYTKRSAAETVGDRVWLIAGEGTPRKYKLRATFLIKEIDRSDKPDFDSRVGGYDGQLLDPMPSLNEEAWFPALLREQGWFASGFNQIRSPAAVNGLCDVLRAHRFR